MSGRQYLVNHRDGKHGHIAPYCSHPDCKAACAQYMLQYRAKGKKETRKEIEKQVESVNGVKPAEKNLLRSSNTRYMNRRKLTK